MVLAEWKTMVHFWVKRMVRAWMQERTVVWTVVAHVQMAVAGAVEQREVKAVMVPLLALVNAPQTGSLRAPLLPVHHWHRTPPVDHRRNGDPTADSVVHCP